MTGDDVLHHWKYFLTPEKDLIDLKNYIEMHHSANQHPIQKLIGDKH